MQQVAIERREDNRMTARTDVPQQPRNLAELFASWGPSHVLNPNEPRAFTKLAARYADLLRLIHHLEAQQPESRNAVLEEAARECESYNLGESGRNVMRAAKAIRALKTNAGGTADDSISYSPHRIHSTAAPQEQSSGARREGTPLEYSDKERASPAKGSTPAAAAPDAHQHAIDEAECTNYATAAAPQDDPVFNVRLGAMEVAGFSFARPSLAAQDDCLTCHGDPAVCASIPGLRHCEKAMREPPPPTPASGKDSNLFSTLMKFYSVNSVEGLVRMQARHIERLQAKLPPLQDMEPRNPRKG